MAYLDLIHNLALLIAISIISVFIDKRWSHHYLPGKILQGLLFGSAAVIGILGPLILLPGLIFDGRSVMISLGSLYFGPVVAAISVVMSVACRISLGGTGMVGGVLVILASAGIALIARPFLQRQIPSTGFLYIFGLVVHLAMVLILFIALGENGGPVIAKMGLPILIFYPMATILVGRILSDLLLAENVSRELRRRERKHRLLFEHVSQGVVYQASDGTVTQVNSSFRETFGLSEEEVVGRKTLPVGWSFIDGSGNLMSPEDYPPNRVFRGESTATAVMGLRTPRKGQTTWLAVNSYAVSDDGDPEGTMVYSTCSDITEQREQEALRREREEYLEAILDTAEDAFWVLGHGGQIVDANRAATSMLGYTRAELCSLAISDIDALVTREEARHRIQQIIREGSLSYATQHRRKDGNLRDVELSVSYLPHKGGRFVCFIKDITAKKRIEAVRDARLKLMNLGLDRKVTDIHQATLDILEALTGSSVAFYHHYQEDTETLSLEAWSSKTLRDFCRAGAGGHEYQLSLAGVWADCIRKREPVVHNDFASVEGKKGMPDGHAVILRELVVPVFRGGKIVAILGVGNKPTLYTREDVDVVLQLADLSWDIAARRSYEEELIKAQQRAETANQAKSEFLANMSHEIRTPLNGVLGMLQIVGESNLDPEQQECIATALKAGESLQSLLADILDLSAMEANKLPLIREPISIPSLIGHLKGYFNPVLQRLPLKLVFEIDENIPELIGGYQVRVRQILVNLVGNAIKFTPSGEVKCSIRLEGTPDTGGFLIMKVRDTGIGVPDHLLTKILDPFTQGDGSFRREFQGAGLGLSIVRRLVDLMEGKLDVQSIEGRGTTVTVALPVLDLQGGETVQREKKEPRPVRLEGIRVMAVEDNPANMKMLSLLLQKLGVSVVCAVNGQEAINILRDTPVDLILMDIQMPIMDGLEATRLIRSGAAGEELRDIPVVALTAHAMVGDRERFLEAGLDEYITKPIDKVILKNVLGRFSQRSSL